MVDRPSSPCNVNALCFQDGKFSPLFSVILVPQVFIEIFNCRHFVLTLQVDDRSCRCRTWETRLLVFQLYIGHIVPRKSIQCIPSLGLELTYDFPFIHSNHRSNKELLTYI